MKDYVISSKQLLNSPLYFSFVHSDYCLECEPWHVGNVTYCQLRIAASIIGSASPLLWGKTAFFSPLKTHNGGLHFSFVHSDYCLECEPWHVSNVTYCLVRVAALIMGSASPLLWGITAFFSPPKSHNGGTYLWYAWLLLLVQELSVRNIFLRLMNFPIVHHGTKNAERVVSILIALQVFFALLPDGLVTCFCSSANAVLYSPDTKVPRTGELVLRRAIPANANMKALQNSLEDISYLLRIPQRKPYGTMEGDVKKALKIATEQKESILGSIPQQLEAKGSMLYASLLDGKGGLQNLIEVIKEKDPDKVSVGLSSSLDTVAELELLQAPGLSFLLPEQYLELPRLTGRGLVEFIIEKGDGSTFFPSAGGEPKSFAMVQVVLDGFSAPLTAGNFAKLVVDGAYDGVKLMCTNQAILSDNELGNYGYRVPLEVMASGQFEPLYKTTLSVQDGELPVLPLSVYGAVAMAHSPDSDEYSSPSQFFFYLYDKRNAGLGGLSFDEGQFSVFGYATVGRDVLAEIKSGDFIRSAKLVQGHDRLVLHEEK